MTKEMADFIVRYEIACRNGESAQDIATSLGIEIETVWSRANEARRLGYMKSTLKRCPTVSRAKFVATYMNAVFCGKDLDWVAQEIGSNKRAVSQRVYRIRNDGTSLPPL